MLDPVSYGVTAHSVDHIQAALPFFSPCRHVVVCSPTGLGCSGRLQLDMQLAGGNQAPARLSAQLTMEPLQLQLHPHHLPLLGQLQQSLASAVVAGGSRGATAAPAAAPADDSWLGEQVRALMLLRVELLTEGAVGHGQDTSLHTPLYKSLPGRVPQKHAFTWTPVPAVSSVFFMVVKHACRSCTLLKLATCCPTPPMSCCCHAASVQCCRHAALTPLV